MRRKLSYLKYASVLVLVYSIWATYICRSYKILEVDYLLGRIYSITYIYSYIVAVILFIISHLSGSKKAKAKKEKKESLKDTMEELKQTMPETDTCSCGASVEEGQKFCIQCGKELSSQMDKGSNA